MEKQAYLEIGNKCHCRCHMCRAYLIRNYEVSYSVALYRIIKLRNAGFKHIRLTGREPLTYTNIDVLIRQMKQNGCFVDITTTLLSDKANVIKSLECIDRLRVSLFATYDLHTYFYNTDKWDVFVKNIKTIKNWNRIKFTYTLTEKKGVINYSKSAANGIINFVKETKLTNYVFELFPDFINDKFTKKRTENVVQFIDVLLSNGINVEYYPIFTKNITICTVNKYRLYIKNNGDVYPCCNAGGEIGQDMPQEVLLGNIDMHSIDYLTSKKLINLDNTACNRCTRKFYKLMEK